MLRAYTPADFPGQSNRFPTDCMLAQLMNADDFNDSNWRADCMIRLDEEQLCSPRHMTECMIETIPGDIDSAVSLLGQYQYMPLCINASACRPLQEWYRYTAYCKKMRPGLMESPCQCAVRCRSHKSWAGRGSMHMAECCCRPSDALVRLCWAGPSSLHTDPRRLKLHP